MYTGNIQDCKGEDLEGNDISASVIIIKHSPHHSPNHSLYPPKGTGNNI